MGARKICVAVNKSEAISIGPCVGLWATVCGIFTVKQGSTHPRKSGRIKGSFRGRETKQDKARRRLRLRAVTAARSADRFQDFYGQEEGVSELFGKFKRGSL